MLRAGDRAVQLRLFLHEALEHHGRPLYEALVLLARQQSIAGATVFRGVEGYGTHHHLHTTRLVDVSDDLPVIVELVDREEAIRGFLAAAEPLIPHGAATLAAVEVVTYRQKQPA